MRMIKRRSFVITGLLILFLLSALTACLKNDYEEQERERIQEYLKQNDIEDDPLESGLYYIETVTGTGVQPVTGDTVEVFYTGRLLNGQVFDTNMESDVFPFPLGTGYVIEGWDEGVSYMREGGEAIFIIPSALAYGPAGTWGIPGYTPLVFEVILDNVIPGPGN